MDEISLHDAMAQGLINRGLTTPEFAAADRAALVVELNGGEEPLTPVPFAPYAAPAPFDSAEPPEEVDELTAKAFAGASSVQDYNFGQVPPGVTYSPAQDLAMRELFVAHEIPPAIGNEVGRLWNQAIINPPNEAQLELSRQECSVALHRMWGNETQKNLAVAQAEVQRMAKSNPEIIAMLEHSGLGNSPWLASTLYNLARVRGRAR